MRIAAIVQARMGSTRLPGKVLRELGGTPVIAWICERLSRCKLLDEIVVATGDSPSDDVLADKLNRLGIHVFRGSEHDVLDRYYRAARAVRTDAVVRVTGDCPLIDPELVDETVRKFLDGQPELRYVSNIQPPTYPDGLDVEVFTLEALYQAWRQAEWSSEREHVTPFMRNHPELFPQDHVRSDLDYSHHRWTLDEEKDWAFLSSLVRLAAEEGMEPKQVAFRGWLGLLERNSDLTAVNEGIVRNEGALRSLQADRKVR
ncbi:NTP transferase domain-containing protein [Cohnella sp. CFH 77786]|uniref:cytidylyltransferase domain-containing protein n=1 Tax=Cohnella sp. CFH 77786 TaxID=2662265 RepID=UPI001C60D260|nr:glycosyltransferase family protein [Cohnella sp. CFH 77786]MBW5448356.1 NTP transferase domain-containing protein [Cohnella sp. CFH 77786]